MNDDRLILHVANNVAELARVSEAVDLFCAGRAIAASIAFKINVALEELLMNTISYGFTDQAAHEILVTLARDAETVTIDIVDDGLAFDPRQAPPPNLDVPLEERRIGGLGIHFVMTMMDAVDYRREDGRNHITLRKSAVSDAG